MRQVKVSFPDDFYHTFMEYLKDKPEVSVDEEFENLDKSVPQWQQDIVLDRIKTSKPEDYRSWEEVKKDLDKKWNFNG
ncbi:hypothetical protein [Flavobacterium nackdongense]|uniref:Addiction module protein n=1 Tax=Flavobacterium nackdongense TaxID=2547394 RepID=A0A4P6YEL4_9FLAO|nr:hypothetical protein [Flavobacterium nackdongense]QBN19274.1 hypothetical protein E1750_10825 [Flavobacterium nackdongense]